MEILEFRGSYRFLSNFYPADVSYELITYPTLEHAFQAAKSLSMVDRMKIGMASSPGKARRMGRAIHADNFRRDWEDVKVGIMEQLLADKFSDPMLRKLLLDTGSAHLEEGNNWGDRFWGTVNGEGLNNLGKLLMQLRENLGGN